MRLESVDEARDALDERVVDLALVLELDNLLAAMVALLVNLRLLGADEGALVDVGMDFNIGIVRQLESVLITREERRQSVFVRSWVGIW